MRFRSARTIFTIILVLIYLTLAALALLAWQLSAERDRREAEFDAGKAVAGQILEQPFIQYDPLLGWRHIPNKEAEFINFLPGRDLHVTINAQGLRAERSYDLESPPGRTRAIALGDSFTFSHVNLPESWPAVLEQILPHLEVLNMGVNGYGVDQMYLLYREQGRSFESQLVICAIIDDDLRRVQMDRWISGYNKPRFTIQQGELVLGNVPVPKPEHPHGEAHIALPQKLASSGEEQLPFMILRSLQELVERDGRRFIVVYLPTYSDLYANRSVRRALHTAAKTFELPILDLTDTIRAHLAIGPGGLRRFMAWAFDREPTIFLPDGHYNERGNYLVAEEIARYVRGLSINLPPESGIKR